MRIKVGSAALARSTRVSAEMLFAGGANIDTRDENGNTPLMAAIWSRNRERVRFLVSSGADVNAKNNDDWTPLHEATERAGMVVVKLLLSKGADVSARASKKREAFPSMQADFENCTALHIAASRGAYEVAKLLVAQGADVNVRDAQGATPLHHAVRKGKDIVELLLSNAGDVHIKDRCGNTPIIEAASYRDKELVGQLIAYGAKDDETVQSLLRSGTTPLHRAAEVGDVSEVQVPSLYLSIVTSSPTAQPLFVSIKETSLRSFSIPVFMVVQSVPL